MKMMPMKLEEVYEDPDEASQQESRRVKVPNPFKSTITCAKRTHFEVKSMAVVMRPSHVSRQRGPNCAICRNKLEDLCIECVTGLPSTPDKYHGIIQQNCDVAKGTCGHEFHNHCIKRWLKTRKVCPLDERDWKLEETTSAAPSASALQNPLLVPGFKKFPYQQTKALPYTNVVMVNTSEEEAKLLLQAKIVRHLKRNNTMDHASLTKAVREDTAQFIPGEVTEELFPKAIKMLKEKEYLKSEQVAGQVVYTYVP